MNDIAKMIAIAKQFGGGSGGGSASAGGAGVAIFHASCDFNPETGEFSNGAGEESFAELKSVYDNDGLLWCRLSMNVLAEGAIPAVIECPLTGVEADGVICFQPLGHMLSMGLMITIDATDTVNVFID